MGGGWGEARWKANTTKCRLTIPELGFLGLERFQRQAPKRLREPVRPNSFKGLPWGMCIGGGGFAPLNSRDRAKGKCDSLPQNMREEGERGKERPKEQDLKERLETPSPII